MIITLMIIGLACGFLSGLALGGGTLLVPALIILLDLSQHSAQAISLASFLPTSLVAVITHYRHGNVVPRLALSIALASVFGAIGGAYIADSLSADLLRKIFGVFLICMGLYEIFSKKRID